MENASKALIIAGAIFLVIIIISFGVYTYQSIHNFSKMQDEQLEQKQVADFNKSFEAYNKSIMYGVDIATLINKVNENNKKYPDNKMEVTFKIGKQDMYVYNDLTGKREKNGTFKVDEPYSNNDFELIKNNKQAFSDFKRRIFTCTGVQYDENTGRISSIILEEVVLNEEVYTHK